LALDGITGVIWRRSSVAMKGPASEGPAAKQRPWINSFQQWLRASQIVSLAGRVHRVDRLAKRINQNVDFFALAKT
jgi:hypothetical protein